MADNTIGALNKLDPALTSNAPERKQSNEEVSKNEFMQLLVTQLKHQDPLNPMQNEEFAVQLAQFSQLEQLVSINDALTGGGGEDFGTMASYLGHEVVLNSDTIAVKGGDGGQVSFDLVDQAAQVMVELLSADGTTVERIGLGSMPAGRQSASLQNLNAPSGEYGVKVTALTSSGVSVEPAAYASGIVNGFIPGPEPTLIVGNREVTPADVKEVKVASQG